MIKKNSKLCEMNMQTFTSQNGTVLFWRWINGSPNSVIVNGHKYQRDRDQYGFIYKKEDPHAS